MTSSSSKPPVYLDSNIFILPVIYSGKKPEAAKNLLSEMVKGKLHGVTSSLTIDEVVWAVLEKTGDRPLAITQGERIFKLASLKIVAVDDQSVLRGLGLMRSYPRLKPRGAIHAGICLNRGMKTIHSDDPDFDCIPNIRRVALGS